MIPRQLNRSSARVLEAIMRLADAGELITLRRLASHFSWASTGWLQDCLRDLREAGLIQWEPTKHGTIRPACRFIPAEHLGGTQND